MTKPAVFGRTSFFCAVIFLSAIILLPIFCFPATEIVSNKIGKVSITSFGKVDIGEIDLVIIGNYVYVSISRPPKFGCGDG